MSRRKKKKLLTEEEIAEKFKDVEFEDNDTKAIIIAALTTFLPAMFLIIGIFVFILWLLFLR
ncbi:hypothetical protein ERUR111494_06135 [Erysipelothrix urinaevulpis]|uniref:hypothetical protein n=1 Tax=Erysipelothrix urinaevulpis TaxID=2683717 RepID=UPI00135AC953|nr:hypothetical protein [Erysipelothrix urinaevulpis]